MSHSLLAIVLLFACAGDSKSDGQPPDDSGSTPETDTPETDTPEANAGFIGSPCDGPEDCPYPDAACLTDGFPQGMCSLACEEFCPDEPGFPVTFCVDAEEAPPAAADLGDGACFSRCDHGLFPGTGCRPGYGCELHARPTGVEQYVCIPGADTEVSSCQQRLLDRGVAFAPIVIPDAHPSEAPGLTCHVQDPVELHSPLLGVHLDYYDGTPTPTVRMSCEGAHALADTVEDITAEGVVRLRHIGTTVCRTIAGTETLSRHAYGDAIDIYGFEFADGALWTLVDHWEHDTTSFTTPEAAWLHDTAWRWHDQALWNIILTPNYNAAHDNHFHVDLTPGSDFLGRVMWPYLGPNTTGD